MEKKGKRRVEICTIRRGNIEEEPIEELKKKKKPIKSLCNKYKKKEDTWNCKKRLKNTKLNYIRIIMKIYFK